MERTMASNTELPRVLLAGAETNPGGASDATVNAAAFADDYTCSACANCCSAVGAWRV